MTWEWDYDSRERRWTITVDGWHAVVQRVDGPQYLWRAHIERAGERYNGPTGKDAMAGRTWCLTKIATLRAMLD
jgi:hypothetical protein